MKAFLNLGRVYVKEEQKIDGLSSHRGRLR